MIINIEKENTINIVNYQLETGCSLLQKTTFQIMKRTSLLAIGTMGLILISSCNSKSEMET